MRYLLFSYLPVVQRERGLLISGLFHWREVFQGEVGAPSFERLGEYDIVHLNFTSTSLALVGDLAQACHRFPKTKLVVNIDFAVDLWGESLPFPSLLLRELDKADLLFHVEPRGAELLSLALRRPVFCIPHPVDTEAISRVQLFTEKLSVVSSIVHRYDAAHSEAWMLMRGLQEEGLDFQTRCILCDATPDEEILRRVRSEFSQGSTWTNDYQDYLSRLAESMVVFDSCNLSTFGRVVAECAALCIPVVGHDCVYASRELYPDLTFSRFEVKKKIAALSGLLNSPALYRSVTIEAYRRLATLFSYEAAKRRFLAALGVEETAPKMAGNGVNFDDLPQSRDKTRVGAFA